MTTVDMLQKLWGSRKFVCVGLDSKLSRLPSHLAELYPNPAERVLEFNKLIVTATADLVCAFKPNMAFYGELGAEGFSVLRDTIAFIHKEAPAIPVILDAKYGDIGNTNAGYVATAFDVLGANGVTVNAYVGFGALKPFLDCKEKLIIALCRTSNPEAAEFQNLPVGQEGLPLWEVVIRNAVRDWNGNGNLGIVAGAPRVEELAAIRGISKDMPILIPGIGAQKGDLKAAVLAGRSSQGQARFIINNSRGIIFASSGEDFADAARSQTLEMHNKINNVLQEE